VSRQVSPTRAIYEVKNIRKKDLEPSKIILVEPIVSEEKLKELREISTINYKKTLEK